MKRFKSFIAEGSIPGVPRGPYQDTKAMKNKMSDDDIKKASDAVLKSWVQRGGANAAAAAAELEKRGKDVPETGSKDPDDHPKNQGDGEGTAGGDKPEDDNKDKDSGTTGDDKDAGTTGDDKDSGATGDDKDAGTTGDNKNAGTSGDVELSGAESKANASSFNKGQKAVTDILGGNLEDTEENSKAAKFKREAERLEKQRKEWEKKSKKIFGMLDPDSPLGKALSDFMGVDPAPFPGMDDKIESFMKFLDSKMKDIADYAAKWKKQQADKASGKSDAAKKEASFRKKSIEDLDKVIDDPDASPEDKEAAKNAKKAIQEFGNKKDEDLLKIVSDKDASAEDKELAQKIIDARLEGEKDDKKDDTETGGSTGSAGTTGGSTGGSTGSAGTTGGSTGAAGTTGATSNNEGYRNMSNTIRSILFEESTQSEYKNMHSCIRDIWINRT